MSEAALGVWHSVFTVMTIASLVIALIGGVGTAITDRMLKRHSDQAARATAREISRVKQRELNRTQAEVLTRHLSTAIGSRVHIKIPIGDQEAMAYAEQFQERFRAAGWVVSDISQALWAGRIPGLWVSRSLSITSLATAPPGLTALLHGLVDAKIPMATKVEAEADLAASDVILNIGSRSGKVQVVR